jgi:outer membrane lipoprotein carrier protein
MNRTGQILSRWRLLLAGCAASLLLPAAQAAQGTALDGYLEGLSTWSARFTQSVTDTNGKRVPEGDVGGRLTIVRPGKFRWESAPKDAPESAQLMIADGRNLWFLDHDLEQATVKPQKEAMPQSPAMLLAGGAGLREAFEVASNGRRDGLEWVRARPKDAESDFREALFGFKGRELSRLVVTDKLGQRSTLSFTDVRRNAVVDPKLVQFVRPEGVDLIGTPVSP